MHFSLFEKIINLMLNKNIISFFYVIFFLSLIFTSLAIYFHPYVGDDYDYLESISKYPNLIEYFNYWYFNWTGRFSQLFMSFWLFSDDLFLKIYKACLIPLYLITFYFFLKNILNVNIKFLSIDFTILFICLWFIYPAINETIFWISGSINYLFPLIFSIFYLGLFTEIKEKNNKVTPFFILCLISSFLSGSSHLQIFSGCFIISTFYMYLYFKENIQKFKSLLIFYIIFLFGGIILIFSPGNFERLGNLSFETTILSTLYKSIIFISSSIFYLGDTQHSLTFFLIIILLFYLFQNSSSNKTFNYKIYYIWLVAFFFTLISTIPAINSINPRVIFFPIFFLTTFFLKLIFFKYEMNYQPKIKRIVFYFLVIIFFLESFLGVITNYAYKKESDIRISIIKKAKEKSLKQVIVSNYTIIPSRLTYMHTPKQDKEFLDNLSNIYQLEIKYDNSFPRSKNIKKDIKFYFDKFKF